MLDNVFVRIVASFLVSSIVITLGWAIKLNSNPQAELFTWETGISWLFWWGFSLYRLTPPERRIRNRGLRRLLLAIAAAGAIGLVAALATKQLTGNPLLWLHAPIALFMVVVWYVWLVIEDRQRLKALKEQHDERV